MHIDRVNLRILLVKFTLVFLDRRLVIRFKSFEGSFGLGDGLVEQKRLVEHLALSHILVLLVQTLAH